MKSAIAGIIVLGSTTLLSPAYATYVLTDMIPVLPSPSNTIPGGNFATYDISYFDPVTQLDYVADRSNASVDIFSAVNNTFVERLGGTPPTFAGQMFSPNPTPPPPLVANNNTSGPDGVQVVNMGSQHQLFVGDGPSTLWAFNIKPPTNTPTFTQLPTLNTGGQFRVDEMAFAPNANTILAANNADTPPFATLVDAKTNTPIATIKFDGSNGFPAAINGIEASTFNPKTGTFFLAIPQLQGSLAGGIAEIDPKTGSIIRVIDLAALGFCTTCSPAGIDAAKNGQLMIGDNNNDRSLIIDPTVLGNPKLIAAFTNITGVDQVWFDPTTGRWFLAARNNPGGPVLGIVDSLTDAFLQNVATTPGDHSVSVDPISGKVFVPFGGIAGNNECPLGCIGVFQDIGAAVPEPSTWAMMLLGFVGLGFAFRQSRRKVSFA